MVAISIGNGSGDAQGSERGLEYDTMSGRYAEFVETEVIPLVEQQCNVKLTKDPEGRATMGGSSGAAVALLLVSAANLVGPHLVRRAIDDGLTPKKWEVVAASAIGRACSSSASARRTSPMPGRRATVPPWCR